MNLGFYQPCVECARSTWNIFCVEILCIRCVRILEAWLTTERFTWRARRCRWKTYRTSASFPRPDCHKSVLPRRRPSWHLHHHQHGWILETFRQLVRPLFVSTLTLTNCLLAFVFPAYFFHGPRSSSQQLWKNGWGDNSGRTTTQADPAKRGGARTPRPKRLPYNIFFSDQLYPCMRNPYYTRSSIDADKPARRVWRSVKVRKHSTIRYVTYGFLLVCYSKFVPKTRSFWDIRLVTMQWSWNPG